MTAPWTADATPPGAGSLRGLRVLLIATSPFFMVRGSPLRTLGFLERYIATGCRVDLLTYPVGADIEREGLAIHRARGGWYRRTAPGPSIGKLLVDLSTLHAAFRLCRRTRYDLVHCEDSEAVAIGILCKRRFGLRVVADFHNRLSENLSLHGWHPLVPPARLVEEWLYRSPDHIVTNSEPFRRFLESRRGLTAAVTMIPDRLTDREAAPAFPLPARYLAYAGNCACYQGVPLLVRAFAALPEAHHDVRLVLVGSRERTVESLVRRLGLEGRVLLPGILSVEETNHVLRRSLFNVIPSRVAEDIPHMKCLHYLAAGRPILATALASSRQHLRHEVNAYLVEPEAGALLRGMLALLEDACLRQRLARAVPAEGGEADDWEAVLRSIVAPLVARPLGHRPAAAAAS